MRYREDASLDTSNVEDRRGGGRGRTLAVGGGGLGVVGVVVVLLLQLLGGGGGGGGSSADALGPLLDGLGEGQSASNEELAADCRTGEDANTRTECAVVADIESIQAYWSGRLGKRYTSSDTVFFTDGTDTGCGAATSGVGPFYCPADEKVYIDLAFYDELRTRFGAEGGLFVDAYVLAHEYGHHVQDLLGTNAKVRQGDAGPTSGSVRLELQADCYAGTWANHATTVPDDSGAPLIEQISQDDIDRALDTAGRIGDDFIQKELGSGTVDEQSFTHGTSAQRTQWFTTGYESGDPARCNTFGTSDLG
ncbi:neutral zinc metallopeptidase [uncultured Amnibacterium sp.]|uniref:KPN_02809 family neutral zinc metallopeptidase n=1 Tax=uncultured Amnibacterium sp. TaxID=1631851 RepID=UPI0035C9D275